MTRPRNALALAGTMIPMATTTLHTPANPSPDDVFRLAGPPIATADGEIVGQVDRPAPTIDVAADDDGNPTGEVVAWPSIYDVPYRMGAYTYHRFNAGVFADSAGEQAGRVPVYCQHGWDWTEQAPIGHTTDVTEARRPTDDLLGMRIAAQVYVDTDTGLSVARCLAARALREWSLGYRIIEFTTIDEDDRIILDIARAELLECSVVLRGANPLTSTEHAAQAAQAPKADPQPDPAPTDPFDGLADLAGTSPSFRAAWRRLNA